MKKSRIKVWLLTLMLTLLCMCGEAFMSASASSVPARGPLVAAQAGKKKKKKKNNKNNYNKNNKNNNNNNNNNNNKSNNNNSNNKSSNQQNDKNLSTNVDENEPAVTEDGEYTSKEEVAAYLNQFGHLPGNFITKNEARDLGWVSREGNLDEVAPGKSIGGDYFGNYEEILPVRKGRKYYECDIDYTSGVRGAERIIYSNDGYIFYTEDHYNTFEQLYPESPDGKKIILGGD